MKTDSPVWFVGASYGGYEDQMPRFLAEGIWENGYQDKYLDVVRSMRSGDRIAIKAAYTRKLKLPFDNYGQTVSVMAIKATGVITENLNDGKRVKVSWSKVEPAREWYFYTHRGTVWRVLPGDWETDGLIAFTFDSKPQDIERFCNAPFWKERFGSHHKGSKRFEWTKFYQAIADKLLDYRDDRSTLIKAIQEISSRVEGLGYLTEDQYPDGTKGFVRDICPFTTFGMFNRGVKDTNRKIIATELARFLKVDEPVPETFEGIPLLNNLKSWYFPPESIRDSNHIDALWNIFEAAIKFADTDNEEALHDFSSAFDEANGRRGVAWNLTFGLYWIRPWAFLSLDNNSQRYLTKKLSIPISLNGPKRRCNSADYLSLLSTLEPRFEEASYPVHSYPELSLEAWLYNDPAEEALVSNELSNSDDIDNEDNILEAVQNIAPIVPYAIDDILLEGCFLTKLEIERMLDRLRQKKNLILQGPPGTGKTWLAKRLAFALIGQKDDRKIRAVQFHPNLSYEDFVRGLRPTSDGKLIMSDGLFMEAIKAASADPTSKFVVVIEEFNRGNPAQIFGELLTLLEAGKRTPSEALELCYPDTDGIRRPVHIPENLFVIGTMNIADRSLALIDLALRRRFAFIGLEPQLGPVWRDWVVTKCNVDPTLIEDIEQRVISLNTYISENLGSQFKIGHSYFTPPKPLENGQTKDWFKQVAETEIGPLLDEYWFDGPKQAKDSYDLLVNGW